MGYADTLCLQLDDRKVVSGDGSAIRVWSHVTGRRIATLKGHTGRVHSVAYDEELVVSGCSQGAVRVWNIDDLKCSRHIRTAHEGCVTGGTRVHLWKAKKDHQWGTTGMSLIRERIDTQAFFRY